MSLRLAKALATQQSVRRWVTAAVIAVFVAAALTWARRSDRWIREEVGFALNDGRQGAWRAVIAKPVAQHPIVLYFGKASDGVEGSGVALRQIAELGPAAVSSNWAYTNSALFGSQVAEVQAAILSRRWAQPHVAWFVAGNGVLAVLQLIHESPGLAPRSLVVHPK